VTNLAGFGVGTFPIVTYTGALSGGGLTVGSKPSGYSVSVNTATANQVRLVVAAQPPPVIGATSFSGGNFVVSGTGPVSENYYVLSSTNAALPVANWTHEATNAFTAGGAFSFTNVISTNAAQKFYRLQLP
jgi:hypothetical protein